MKDKIKIVYILSYGHSGSTLLSMLLEQKGPFFGIGEAEKIAIKTVHPETSCFCGLEFNKCPFWNNFVQAKENSSVIKTAVRTVNQSKYDFVISSNKYTFRGMNGQVKLDTSQYVDFYRRLLKYANEKSGERIIVDSSKNVDHLSLLLKNSSEFDFTVVHLVRDGRGVMNSYKKKYNRSFLYVFHWLLMNIKIILLKRRFKQEVNFVTVSYSDLAKNSDSTISRVCELLNLQPYRKPAEIRKHHYVAGNKNAVERGLQEIKEDLSWKTGLNTFEKIMFMLFFSLYNKLLTK